MLCYAPDMLFEQSPDGPSIAALWRCVTKIPASLNHFHIAATHLPASIASAGA